MTRIDQAFVLYPQLNKSSRILHFGMTSPVSMSNGNHRQSLDRRVVPPMGMSGKQFQEAALSVVNDIEHYYTNIQARAVVPSIAPGYLQKLLPSQAPEHGETWQAIEKDIESTIMPGVTHWQSPKFMAFFPANSTYPGILGEMWSAALTAPAFNWICSPVVTELETIVLDWLAQILALPKVFYSAGSGGGVIQGSASEAIVTVMVAARERFIRRQIEREGITATDQIEDRSCDLRSTLVALGSEQAHSSTKKAAIIAGTRYRSIATKASNEYGMTGHQVRQKIEELKNKGLQPYYLTVSLGTTNTCAVDDFASIAEVAKDYPDIWIHCDAAYAGAALVLPEYQKLAKELTFVDSFNVNMHKWLLVNFDASCLYVQNRRDLTEALSVSPAYLKNQFSESGLVTDYRDWQIPLGRRFRALKMWFVIRTWGVEGMRAHIRHGIALGELFANLIRSRPDLFTIITPPAFALTVFTVTAPTLEPNSDAANEVPRPKQDSQTPKETSTAGKYLDVANRLTKDVYTIIDEKKEFFLTSSIVGETFAIRVVSANPFAEEAAVRKIFDELVMTTESVLAKQLSA
nr:aromatic-l-amino-acid decarboxylase [Quercus suber]